jgi:hypothetical protein
MAPVIRSGAGEGPARVVDAVAAVRRSFDGRRQSSDFSSVEKLLTLTMPLSLVVV